MMPASTHRKVWGVPSVLAALTLAGLLSALLGEDPVWKALAWTCLSAPVAVGLWFAWRRKT
jgi:hypothetical protein